MKKMQDEYWVAKAGPASDLTQMKVRQSPSFWRKKRKSPERDCGHESP